MLIDYVLKYIAQGLPVIPLCYPNAEGGCGCGRGHTGQSIGKVPLTQNGLKDGTIEKQRVLDYWKRYPKANIGIVIPPNLFVLDVDAYHKGYESLGLLQENIGELPQTLQITTGSGGAHLYYKTDKEIRNTTGLGGYEGLDIRGVGGYVIAPPSLHRSGLPYETSPIWDGEIVMAPPQLIKLCLKQPAKNGNTPIPGTTYQEGQRNDRLTRDAGAMRRRGLPETAIYAALQVVNQEQCQPPLEEAEVRLIAKSISRYAPQLPLKRMGVEL